MNQQENNNIKVKIRSKVWGEFLKNEKELNKLFEDEDVISEEIEIAKDCGDINKWQEQTNKYRQLKNKVFIKQMQLQKMFFDIADLKKHQNSNFYNN